MEEKTKLSGRWKLMARWITDIRIDLGIYDDEKNMWGWHPYEGASPEIMEEALMNGDVESEISVVRADNKHGWKSYGWGGRRKIILFSNADFASVEEIEWAKEVANVVAKGLNGEEL